MTSDLLQAASQNRLLVDVGNSRIKWCLQSPEGELFDYASASYPDKSLYYLLGDHWSKLEKPELVAVATVSGALVQSRINEWCTENWDMPPRFVYSEAESLGVRNGFDNPERLGTDRWAALVAARSVTQRDSIVIDCGTATTIDILMGSGLFVGGAILPGAELMRSNLAIGTARLGLGPASTNSRPGTNTDECIALGCEQSALGAVTRIVSLFSDQLGSDPEILLTGGAAQKIKPVISGRLKLLPDLVLRGVGLLLGCQQFDETTPKKAMTTKIT